MRENKKNDLKKAVNHQTTDLIYENQALVVQNQEHENKIVNLTIANRELVWQSQEQIVREENMQGTNEGLIFQNQQSGKKLLELDRANRLYGFISQVNQNIVRVNDEQLLFYNACKIAVEFGKFKLAWIGLFENENRQVTLVDQVGMPKEDTLHFNSISIEKNSPEQHVLNSGRYYVNNDLANVPGQQAAGSFAGKYGICSCIILPVKKSGHIIGTFNLYSGEANFFSTEEIKLLVEVTGDISFALDAFEKEKSLTRVQGLLLQNEKRFRSLVEKSTDMVTLSDAAGRLIYGSPYITTVLGYSPAELDHMSVFHIIHADDVGHFIAERSEIKKTEGKAFHFEHRRRHKNGRWIWCDGTCTNMLKEPGINAIVSNFRDISEKKLVDEQLKLTQLAIDNAGDAVYWMTSDSRIVKVNKAACTMLGYTSADLVKLSVPDIDPAYDGEKWQSHFAVLREKGSLFFETVQQAKAGHLIPVEIRANYLMFDNIEFNCAFCRDISDRKAAEAKLVKSEAFNRGVLNSLISNIAVIDNTGKIIAVNEPWKRFGQENGAATLQGTAVGSNYFDVCERSTLQGEVNGSDALLGIKNVMSNKEIFFYMEYPCHSPTQKRWFGMRAMKFDSGEPMVVISHNNITERMLAEENVLHSESLLKEAQSIAHIGNFDIDLATNSESWSDEMYKIYGVNKRDTMPSTATFLSFIHPDDVDYVNDGFIACLKTLQSTSFAFRFIRKDGAVRFGNSVSRFYFDNDHKPIRLYGIFQDVTKTKLAEMERSKMVNDLMVRNTKLEQFGYIISHNLRAPVANIIGATGILQDSELSAEDKAVLNKGINDSVVKLDEVIKDLNHILQVKSDINEKKEKIHFSNLVNDIMLSIVNLIDKYGITINTDFTQADEFFGLKSYLYSIFYNLIVNSIKYRRTDVDCVIDIKSEKVKAVICLIFKDNGTGFDLTHRGDEVFGLYKRFHSDIEGKGMGLFMVKTQVEMLGGKISLMSSENKRAEFRIEFEVN